MAKDRVIRPLMYKAVKMGTSFNAFYRAVREKGYETYRRATMLADWSDVRNEVQSAKKYASMSAGDIPEPTEVSAIKFTMPGRFYYRLRVEAEHLKRGPLIERFVTIVSETMLTVGEVYAQLQRKWRGYDYGLEEKLVKMELLAVLHRAE